MRRVEVCGHSGASSHVEVPLNASLEGILRHVAMQCAVEQEQIRISVDGHHAGPLKEVPSAEQVVTAAVRTEEQVTAVTRATEEVSIPPKPVIFHQDMEGLSAVVAFDEIIDNSIRANAKLIVFASNDDGGGVVKGLVCRDDGNGMAHDLAINYMRLAHTDSGIVSAPREENKPLAAPFYFSKELSRHGKGAAALLYFGNKVETVTKTQEAAEVITVNLDYEQWLAEFEQKGTCTYTVRVKYWFNFVDERDSYTDIGIGSLRSGMAKQLADGSQRLRWAQQVADHYYFFIHGFPEALWATLPADLQPSAQSGRPAGGLSIDLFGTKLRQGQALPAQVRPRLGTLLDTWLQLQQQFGKDKLVPFWLPIRWCEPGMKPEEVPNNITVDRPDGRGPAGKLHGVHRDFLMLLLYWPYEKGQPTKPQLVGDAGAEDILFTAWSGRLIPKAFFTVLPPIVAEARQTRGLDTSWKLGPSRLCAVLFCSPEVYTSNHKTELLDEAFDAVTQRLGGMGRQYAGDDLWVWDTSRHKWCASANASKLLVQHHRQYWAPLEQEGEVRDIITIDANGDATGRTFVMPGGRGTINAGDLVRLLRPEELQTASEAGSSLAAGGSNMKRGGGGQAGKGAAAGRGPKAGSPDSVPMHYRIVEHFTQRSALGDGPRIRVLLREWAPEWVATGQGNTSEHAASLITPVNQAQAAELRRSWNATAPKALAWWDASKSRDSEKIVQDIVQMSGVSSAQKIASSQVPPSLTVCFITAKKLLANIMRDLKWSSSIYLGATALSVSWELLRGDRAAGGRMQYESVSGRTNSVQYSQTHKAKLQGWQDLVQEPGHYCIRMTSACPWVEHALEYKFEVTGNQAHELSASWDKAALPTGSSIPRVRLEEELPSLEIRARDANGKTVPLPFSSSQSAKLALQLEIKCADGGSLQAGQPREVILATDKEAIKVKGWRLLPQELRVAGNAPLVEARIVLRLKLPDNQTSLALPELDGPSLFVLSGQPARLEAKSADFMHPQAEPLHTVDVSRGSRVLQIKLLILDASGNTLHLEDSEAFCARVRFDPPNAAIKEGSKDYTAQRGNEAGSSSKRRKSAATPSASPSANGAGWPIKVDGNVVEVLDNFRWCVPPGAGPVAIIIEVFRGRNLPRSDNAEPLLKHTGWYRMQEMHIAVEHSAIADLQSAGRWQLWRSREVVHWPAGVTAFVLNTSDFSNRVHDKHVPCETGANVHTEVLERFCEGYEPRLDVLAGQLAHTFITPAGRLVRWQQSSERQLIAGKVPYFLAKAWNNLLDKQWVYEAAFLVAPDVQELPQVTLTICNEADHHDNDFSGRAQLQLLGPDRQLRSVFSADVQLDIASGLLLLPSITINPEWFTADSKGMATLVLTDEEPFSAQDPAAAGPSTAQQWQWQPQKELGRFYIRLAPAAEQLLLMAAGPLFQHATVMLEGRGHAGSRQRRAQQDVITCKLDEQIIHGGRGGAGSSRQAAAASQGAWSPWRSAAGGTQPGPVHIDPRRFKLRQPLQLQLGQTATLHFVATDFMGCPAELSKEQRRALYNAGVQLLSPDDVLHWNWGSATSGSSSSSALAAAAEAGGHLGGPFVNSCTFRVMRGCGRAELCLRWTGSFGRTSELKVPVLLQAGPVAVDGVRLQLAMEQPRGALTATRHACDLKGYLDLATWQLLQAPAAAAVTVKQEPGLEAGPSGPQQPLSQQQQQQQQQEHQQHEAAGSSTEVIDLTLTSEEEEEDGQAAGPMEVDEQQAAAQRPLCARQQWLASLSPDTAALLYELEGSAEVTEGGEVHLQLQLVDSSAHEVAAEKTGKLVASRAENWQVVQQQQQQQQQQQEGVEGQQLQWQQQQEFSINAGRCTVVLPLGVGDGWCGEQLFRLQPRAAAGSELAAALPVLLKLNVKRGPFPDAIKVLDLSHAAAAAEDVSTCPVPAADALTALCGRCQDENKLLHALFEHSPSTTAEQRQVTLLPQLSGTLEVPVCQLPQVCIAITSRDGSSLPLHSLGPLEVELQQWVAPGSGAGGSAGSWVPVSAGPVAVQAVWEEVQQEQEQLPVYRLPLGCRQLPPEAGFYRLRATYNCNVLGLDHILEVLGPFLLLPGPPCSLKLTATDGTHQQEAVTAPPQSTRGGRTAGPKRRSGRNALPPPNPAAAAAGGGGPQGQAAPSVQQLVLLQDLPNTCSMQLTVQLQDCWGNKWRPAGEQLLVQLGDAGAAAGSDSSHQHMPDADGGPAQPPSKRRRTGQGAANLVNAGTANPAAVTEDPEAAAAATGAGAGDAPAAADGNAPASAASSAAVNWQLHLLVKQACTQNIPQVAGSLPFADDGSCTVPPMALSQLRIDAVGEFELYGQAAAALSTGCGIAMDLNSPSAEALREKLASWLVASESTAELSKRKMEITAKLKALKEKADAARHAASRVEVAARNAAAALQQATEAAATLQQEVQQREVTLRRHPELQMLQQAAAQAAAQSRQLDSGGGHPPMLDVPWIRGGRRQQPDGPVSGAQMPSLVPAPMLQLHRDHHAVLGPLVTLGAFECHDVAVAVSAHLRGDLNQLVCLDEAEDTHIRAALGERDYWALSMNTLFRFYCPQALQQGPGQASSWYARHPQQLVHPNAYMQQLLSGVLDWQAYYPEDGFVGFAVNLVQLNQQLLSLQVSLKAKLAHPYKLQFDNRAVMQLNLRHTLWNWKLGNVLVFETEEHIDRFRARVDNSNRSLDMVKLIALDGYTFNVRVGSKRHRLVLDTVTTRFAPAGPAAADNPLDLRLRAIKERQQRLEEAQERLRRQQEEVHKLERAAQQKQQQLVQDQKKATEAEESFKCGKPELAAEMREVMDALGQRGQH